MTRRLVYLPKPRSDWASRTLERLVWFTGVALLSLTACNLWAAPPAGSVIGNQAAATYTDASAVSRTATSNPVTTLVQQVAALTLASSQTRPAAPGAPVSFPHTLTNTGNGADSFALNAVNATGDNFDFTAVAFYADANCDGVADNATAITVAGPVAAGGSACVVVQAMVPGAAASSDTGRLTLTATSQFSGAATATNTDEVSITANAVLNVGKAVSASSGDPGSGPHTYTLSYTNTGNSAATNVALRDVIPAGMTYVAGSGRWSAASATPLSDAAGGDPAGVAYDFGVTSPGTVTAVIASVAPNVTGTLTFQVTVDANRMPGALNNTAQVCYFDGAAQVPAGCTPTSGGAATNTVPFTVNQVALVTSNGSPSSSTANADPAPIGPAAQGATVSFDNYVWNRGNGADSFDITVAALGGPGNTFPAGTTFQLFKSDGVTPLIDTNGNGVPDTGSIAPTDDASCTVANGFVADTTSGRCGYRVILRAILPPGATGGPYSVTKTATSRANTAVSDPVTDTLTSITTSTVDLRNGAANGAGSGTGPEASPVTTLGVTPGATVTFVLQVNNTSGVADTYHLSASTDSSFATVALPSGWSVSFAADGGAGDCTTSGATLSNTGLVNAGATKTICAVVSVPAGAAASPAPGTSLYFRALSPTSGAADRKHDAVEVNTVRAVSIAPSNTGQIYPGGAVVYTHTVTNNGNVPEGDAPGEVALGTAMSGVTGGWSNVVYWDKNNDGVLGATDPVVADLSQLAGGTGGASVSAGLDPGESARLFVRVFAPGAAAIGEVNAVSLTVTPTGVINTIAAPAAVSVSDTTTVIAGQVRLVKEQALDANCDGTPDTAYGQAQIASGALPGTCVRYRITATNEGSADVTTLVVSDATPANTRYHDGTAGCGGTLGTAPAASVTAGTMTMASGSCGASAAFQASVGTLSPAQSAVITFGVRIDP